jgi:alpha-tubulin suppressor-like RCC1 family protein
MRKTWCALLCFTLMGGAVRAESSAQATGAGSWGELGIGQYDGTNLFTPVIGSEGVRDIRSGYEVALMLMKDGTVRSAGNAIYGDLGTGSFSDSNSVFEAIPGLTDIKQIAIGGEGAFAVKRDGTVMAWGYNIEGELGLGYNTNNPTPSQIPGLSNVETLVYGMVGYHAFAILYDGTVYGWGWNADGQLGLGTIGDTNRPTLIPDLNGDDLKQLESTYYNSYALMNDGTVWTAGRNEHGALGDGTTNSSSTFMAVPGLSNVTKIAGGGFHAIALLQDGTLVGWGRNDEGQLGLGHMVSTNRPTPIPGLSNIVDVTAGEMHSIAVDRDGVAYAWGRNVYGQFGNGDSTSTDTATVIPVTNFSKIVAGANHTFALFGLSKTILDFDGDGVSDIAVYYPESGNWYVRRSSDGVQQQQNWGWSEADAAPGDFDGDGITDFAVYHQAAGNWFVRRSSDSQLWQQNWGWNAATPVIGDFDGDGKDDLAVYHQAAGDWYIRRSSDGQLWQQNWGWFAATPAPGDYDGDGTDDLAVYHQASGNWFIRRSSDGELWQQNWGWNAATAVPGGDYDGDGTDDLAVYHQAEGDWYVRLSSNGQLWQQQFGWSAASPVAGDFDGDGTQDLGVFDDPADWYILQSTDGFWNQSWGSSGAEAVTPNL